MPNTINLRLLENKNIVAELNGMPLGNANSYKITAGEENSTKFKIASKPQQYANATYTVEMVNSQGYGVKIDNLEEKNKGEYIIQNDIFTLPTGMAVAGYGSIQIRAYLGEEKVPFEVLKVKVFNTIDVWTDFVENYKATIENKLDKYNGDGVNYYLYAVHPNGAQKNILYNIGTVPNSIVGRDENGRFLVTIPTAGGHPTPKHYVDALFNGANKAIVFNDYPSMFTDLKAQSKDKYSIGQNVFIVQLGVPDLWISGIEETFNDAIYGDDENFIEFLNQHGSVQIGYYRLSALETQKVDLLDYYDKEELDSMFGDKLDKKTDGQPFIRLYAVNENGEQTMLNVSNSNTYLTIPVRDENGTFDVLDPQGDKNPVTLGYFNEKVDKKIEEAIDDIEIPEPEIVIKGNGAPTTATVGKLGSFYFDTTNTTTYQCVAIDTDTPSYTWVKMIRETDLSSNEYLARYRYNESNGLYTLEAGLLKYEPPQYGGLFKSTAGGVGSGALRIKSAQYSDIDSRIPTDYYDTGVSGANKCNPIVPANLDYAVFAVLTNPKITLTDEQKATIKANLGIE